MILVLGASSFIGRHFIKAQGDRAIGTHLNNPFPDTVFYDATRMPLSDILPTGIKFSHAVLFYAESGVDECKQDIKKSQVINVASVKLIIDDLIKNNIKPVFMSSEYVFDGSKGNYTEEDQANPNTVYGTQKLEIEKYLQSYCKEYAILRLAKVFSTDPKGNTILCKWFNQICQSEEIQCAIDQVFSPIHVDDVVAMISAVIELNSNGIFNISNRQSCSRFQMLNILTDCLKTDVRIKQCRLEDLTFLDNRPRDLSLNPEKIIKTTGIRPKAIRECCEEFSSQVQHNGLTRK